jgi:hypothetical protein
MASKRVLRLEKTENFINEDFSDMTLTKLDISKKLFKSCNFDRTHFVNLDFDSCIFIDCSFKNCNFYNIEINHSQIIRCDFRNSSFQDFSIENTFKSDNVFLNLDINSNVSGISEDETGISQNVIRIPEFVKSLEQSSGVNVNIPEDEEMCEKCRENRDFKTDQIDYDNDEDWKNYVNDDIAEDEEEETEEEISLSKLAEEEALYDDDFLEEEEEEDDMYQGEDFEYVDPDDPELLDDDDEEEEEFDDDFDD